MVDMLFYLILLSVFASNATGQKNLTPEGKAYQSSTYRNSDAENAPKGPASSKWSPETCSHTGGGDETKAWWKLLFNELVFITNITLYLRNTDATMINGFSLYIGNNTGGNLDDNSLQRLCYKDPDTPGENQIFEFDIDCHEVGYEVIVYNTKGNKSKVFVMVCYVEVHGCPIKMHGVDCTESCPSKCINQHCFPENGSCVLGCGSGNCLNNNCDDNETCTEGCKSGHNGQFCTKGYNNLALNESKMPSPSPSNLQLVVDGRRIPGSCSMMSGLNTWMQINLKELSIIVAVYLHFEDTSKDEGDNYYIYCNNDTRSNGSLLYKGQKPTNDIHIAPRYKICRNIRFIPPQNNVSICEIEVIGCHSGYYGKYCNISCPQNCGGPCDPDTGNCIYGCTDGYYEIKCDKICQDGKFGSQCLKPCSPNCAISRCDHVTGKCVKGICKVGWTGFNCTTECSHGTYGENCSESCSGCVGELCNHVDGVCNNTNKCKPGWKVGPKCNEKCDSLTYGKSCLETCDGCWNGTCDFVEGLCNIKSSCKPGWKFGPKCNEKCSHGTYGRNCSESCSGCVSELCNHVDGVCNKTKACKPGWKVGPKCNEMDKCESKETYYVSGFIGVGAVAFASIVFVATAFILIRRRYIRKHGNDENRNTAPDPCNGYETSTFSQIPASNNQSHSENEHQYDALSRQTTTINQTRNASSNDQTSANTYELINL